MPVLVLYSPLTCELVAYSSLSLSHACARQCSFIYLSFCFKGKVIVLSRDEEKNMSTEGASLWRNCGSIVL